MAKPGGPFSVGELRLTLASKIRAAAAARLPQVVSEQGLEPAQPRVAMPCAAPASPSTVIAIGASTGGTEAIQQVLAQMPENSPAVAIVQHIPAVFSRAFANRLNQICPLEVKEACDGDELRPGRALVAPGNFHMLLRKSGQSYRAVIKEGPLVCYQRPSVDVLFSSVAEVAGADAVGVLLTGMGSDGAQGMSRMQAAGARTIAQDEASCVVFGMPREAIVRGAADHILPLSRIPSAILFLSLCGAQGEARQT
jgi:two-component system chemotaxis response regulator CheB